MNYIDYEDKNEDICAKLDIKIGSRKYFENFDDEILQDPFNPFVDSFPNTTGFKPNNSVPFSSLHRDISDPSSINHSNDASEHSQVRIKREESNTTFDGVSVDCSVPDPISTKSKRIQKREQAKQRNQARLPKVTQEAVLSGEIPEKYIPEDFNRANLDEKTKKRMLQMIRNRISAQNSRDRKKNLIESLESQQRALAEENLKLKNRVRQLEDANAQLQKENQEFKKSLANVLSGENHNIFELSDNTQSPDLSGVNSPIVRMGNRSGSFMKYSLALVTIFAVVMFTGMSPTTNKQVPVTMLSVITKQPAFQAPASKINHARILEEEKILIEPAQSSKDLMLRMEEKPSFKQQCVSTDLEDYTFVNQISDLQRNFNEKHMSKFFNQLKVDPIIIQHNRQQQLRLNARSEGKALMEYNFSTYLRSSRRQFPPKLRDPSNTQLVLPFAADGSEISPLKGEKFSSIFCPAGFEFQTQEQDPNFKIEKGAIGSTPQKKLKLQDSEWLQLFVPKSNISIVKSSSPNELEVSSLNESKVEDGTMLEVWCKVFYVRELPSGL